MPKQGWSGGFGVNKDAPPFSLKPGWYSDSNNFRFRNGHDEVMGGIAEIMATPSITSYALFDFQTTSARFVIEAGIAKVYAHNGTSRTEITKGVQAVAVSSITDSTPNTTRLVTTSTAHGLSTGNRVTIYGVTGTNDDSYNEENVAITVLSSTTFSYEGGGANNPVSPAGGSPAYVVTSSSAVNFTGSIDDKITGGHLAGMFILNNPVDGLFYWNGDTATDLRPFEITTYVADVGRPFREHFFQGAPTISSVKYPRRLIWSDAAAPGSLPSSFVPASSNEAGTAELDDTNGFIVDFAPLGDDLHVYKSDLRYRVWYIGGDLKYAYQAIQDPSGLMARNCIANTQDGRQVFLTPNCDVRIHAGGISQSIAEGVIRNYLASDIDSTYKTRAFLAPNPATKEIWIFYPRSGSSVCNGVIVWNWEANTWQISHRSLNFTAAMAGLVPTSIATDRRLIVATSAPKLGNVDSGTTDFGSTITKTIERTGLHFEARRRKKTLHTSNVDADATTSDTATITHGSHARPDASATYATGVTYTHNTTRDINAFATSAEHLAWKLSTTSTTYKQRSVELEYNEDGEF